MTQPRVALVTGANRGIGFEICRQLGEAGLIVVVTARDAVRGQRAVADLLRSGHGYHACSLDVTDGRSIEQAMAFVEREFARLDVLINNAAISTDRKINVLNVDMALCHETFDVNFFGPFRLCRACIPLMQRNGYGRIVNVSSGRGSFTKLAADGACYRISKTALNALTCVLADELRGTGILVNAMTPGWVRTRLGGLRAPRSVTEGAQTAVWLATLPEDGPHGRFFKDKEEFPW